MEELKNRILREGVVLPGNVLKVNSFLNQQIDVALFNAMGAEFARLFEGEKINKILTVEVSGVPLACVTAQYFNNVPVVFGKKHKTSNRDAEVYSTPIFSFTHQSTYEVEIPKRFLAKGDRVLVIDDFLANGEVIKGLQEILLQAGATLVGAGIAVEKGFQGGGDKLRAQGIRVESLAIVESMENGHITFRG